MTYKGHTPRKGLCLTYIHFLKLENIETNKIKISEMGK